KRVSIASLIFVLLLTQLAQLSSADEKAGRSQDPGIQELRTLVVGAAGKPAETDLLRVESKYKQTRAAALARFLRGYLHYGGGTYAEAIEALDPRAIGAASALGDYALQYRAESEAIKGSPRDALRDYSRIGREYPDSLLARAGFLKAAEIS